MLTLGLPVLLFLASHQSQDVAELDRLEKDFDQHARRVVKRDSFPVFNNPEMLTAEAAEAKKVVLPRDPVIGVTHDGEAKAYPIPIMGVHELGNDTLGGLPIAPTWWPLCQTAIVYERTLDGEVLEFGHEGILYENSFIFYDKKTESLWVHVTAQAIKGPLRGRRLKILPSTVTSWAAWKKKYPDTLVLGGRRRDGFMGTFTGLDDKAVKKLGLAVFHRGEKRLYPYSVLDEHPVLEDELGGDPIVLVFSRASGVVRAFVRTVEDEDLSFVVVDADARAELLIKDTATDSIWDGLSGTAVDGAFEGEQLDLLVAYAILRDRYPVFHPDGTVWSRESEGR